MLAYRLTPWKDYWEFHQVGEALLSAAKLPSTTETHVSLSHALEMVSVWRLRSDTLPHSVESTAALALVLYREETDNALSTTELRLSLSSAIIRSINGLADSLQQQRSSAAAVSSLCAQLGIPVWLVDVRHEATHNQMPSLPVLRMAAVSLLQYFGTVYWDRIAEERQELISQGMKLLEEYKVIASQKPIQYTIETRISPNIPDIFESDDESTSGNYIGSFVNRFSALEEPNKEEETTKKKRKRRKKASNDPRLSNLIKAAEAFIQAPLPRDVAYEILLSFLVYGNSSQRLAGILLVSETTSKDSFEELKSAYCPLISAVGKEWPGFLHSLLVHLVDRAISLEKLEARNLDIDRQLILLSRWVRILCSVDFLSDVDPAVRVHKTGSPERLAPLYILEHFQYPLNALSDRCQDDEWRGESRRMTSRSILKTLLEILGDKRIPFYGVSDEMAAPCTSAIHRAESQAKNHDDSSPLNLAEIEALLSGENKADDISDAKGDQNNSPNEDEKPKVRFVRCTSWEPCAIGVLPGYPC